MRCIVLASTSAPASVDSARWARRWPRPSRPLMRRSMSSPCSIACVTCQRRSMSERMSCHSPPSCDQARTQSPARMPALSATLAANGGPSTAFGSSTPIQCAAAYSATARARLAIGPAATIAARCQSGLRLKAPAEIGGGDVAFALVEHAHVAAEGQRADDELGAVGPRLATPEDAAEADREAQHLDAAGDGDPVVAVLVDDDEDAERQEEGEDGDHHQRPSVARSGVAPTRERFVKTFIAPGLSGTRGRADAPRGRARATTRANRQRPARAKAIRWCGN